MESRARASFPSLPTLTKSDFQEVKEAKLLGLSDLTKGLAQGLEAG